MLPPQNPPYGEFWEGGQTKFLPCQILKSCGWQMEETCSFRFILVFRCQCGWWLDEKHTNFLLSKQRQMSRRQELCHLPRAKLASGCAKVGILVPVLVLSRPQLSTKQRRSYSTALVDVDSFFQDSPGSVMPSLWSPSWCREWRGSRGERK